MVVIQIDEFGHPNVLETEGTPLRLVHEFATTNSLGNGVTDRTIEALRGFRAIARGANARNISTVATAAVREAADGDAFVQRLRDETGLDIEIISGDSEARYGFLGGVYGIPADDGVLMDIGGGSVQLARFRDRGLEKSWSVPLGALRLSDRFLLTDPPTASELRRLQEHVRETLRAAGAPELSEAEQVVGTGGTIRNLAKIDRAGRDYPIRRLHGYTVEKRELSDLLRRLADQSGAQRAKQPGLNPSRFDSIVGGAACAHAALEVMGASNMIVSGQGLREGIALAHLGDCLPPPKTVRAAAVASLAARFSVWDPRLAQQRTQAVLAIQPELASDLAPELIELLLHGATLLDIGRSVDFYSRHDHASSMVLSADLSGFTHRALALLSATIKFAEKDLSSLKAWAPLLQSGDQATLARLGALLGLADAIARQSPADAASPVRCFRADDRLTVHGDWLDPWLLQSAARRVQNVFAVTVGVGPT